MCNRKGYLLQNCLFICDFECDFTYTLCGWDGLVSDGALWRDAVQNGLEVPVDRYLLADAGFPSSDALLVPYCGVHYHLKEWCQGRIGCIVGIVSCFTNPSRPRNDHELFNLRHTALHNIMKHIFGVIKCQWHILNLPPKYSMDVQACIPAALCALHNFINHFDAEVFNQLDFDWEWVHFDKRDDYPLVGSDQKEPAVQMGHETECANQRHEAIAQAMWADYVAECLRQGIPLPM